MNAFSRIYDPCVFFTEFGGWTRSVAVSTLVFAQYCHVLNSLCCELSSIIKVELHGLRLYISEGLISVAKV